MHGSSTTLAQSPDFQRSFVALRYFWGARAQELTEALTELPALPTTANLLEQLSHATRAERARALGEELGRLSKALELAGSWQ